MPDKDKSDGVGEECAAPKQKARAGIIGYIKTKLDERRSKYETEPPTDKAARITAVATRWIAFLTFVLAGIAVYQFFIIRGQLKVMRKDQQAWVQITVDSPNQQLTQPLTVGKPFVVPMNILQTGKTPALNWTEEIRIEIVKFGDAPIFNYHPSSYSFGGALMPNDPQPVVATLLDVGPSGNVFPHLITPNEFTNLIVTHQAYLVIFGHLDYRDVFGIWHRYQFCRNQLFGYAPTNIQVLSMHGCPDYNYVDDN